MLRTSLVACTGNPYHIEKTILLALEHQVIIGAHPPFQILKALAEE